MKNLLAKKSYSEQFAEAIGDIAKECVMIAIGFFVVISRLLYRFRKFEWKLGMIILGFYIVFSNLLPYAYAPKAAHAMDGQKPMIIHTDLTVKEIVLSMTAYEFGQDQVPAMENLLTHESGFDPKALNPNSGACGLFQSLPCNKMDSMDLHDQIKFGFSYIKNRYGTPAKAWAFWQAQKPHWY